MSFYHKMPERKFEAKKIDTTAIVMQAGKPINWKKFTQDNNIDLDIYEVREKYDGEYRNHLKYDPEIEAAEIDHTMTLEKVYERNKAIQNQWLNLPEKIRMEFSNDVNEFVDRGQEWLNKKREEQRAAIKAQKTSIVDEVNAAKTIEQKEKIIEKAMRGENNA